MEGGEGAVLERFGSALSSMESKLEPGRLNACEEGF